MLDIKQALIYFFKQVAIKDKALLKKLHERPCFKVEQEGWCFTLPELYSFLQHQDEVFSCIDYKQFRQIIFNSPINKSIKLCGAEIIITDNKGKVDKSSYALIWK